MSTESEHESYQYEQPRDLARVFLPHNVLVKGQEMYHQQITI